MFYLFQVYSLVIIAFLMLAAVLYTLASISRLALAVIRDMTIVALRWTAK
jgi:hypothetical protein